MGSFRWLILYVSFSFCDLPCLSLGEIVVNEVNFVRKCVSAENSQEDLWGKLICTNFKVSFIPQDDSSKQVFVQSDITRMKLSQFVSSCGMFLLSYKK